MNELKKAETAHPVLPVIAERWSPYAYDPRPVEREKLLSCLEAARWAPSSYNEQLAGARDYLGPVWYETEFVTPRAAKGDRAFLRFDSVNYLAKVWLNGKKVGEHEGGHLPFEVEKGKTVEKAIEFGTVEIKAAGVLAKPEGMNSEAKGVSELHLPAGPHKLSLIKDGETRDRDIVVEGGDKIVIDNW